MSRSAPNDTNPNPATRWFSWKSGGIIYWDKESKKNIKVPIPFEFILLDELSTIKGWHDSSESSLYSNEVKDTRDEPFVVKAFKQLEVVAEGFYSDIKDKVKASGGKFTTNLYIAYTNDQDELALGSLQFHASALSAWMGFKNDKANRNLLYKKGIKIAGKVKGKKGSITFEVPTFELVDLPELIQDAATDLDRTLQTYLASYFKRTRVEQATHVSEHEVNQELLGAERKDDLDQTQHDAGEIDF